ncbi:UDP-glucuronosyl/UDP-glucosyltransferase [Artemisia annua]|uniref:UDP-glucuronosyl/UDP-glucosyltransferase n=1 Tax=Artemisia annua TaxID=35608 RepID=A0A2U1QGY0_ARTAN|nr:UDP-glucuronosyl/UDP-glucosyltransferase [Artemisia annua]
MGSKWRPSWGGKTTCGLGSVRGCTIEVLSSETGHQFSILSDRAVGSFLTNCGWNSVMEGLNAGMTMLTWPIGSFQFVNSKLLVDDLGVAKQVCEGGGADSVPESMQLASLLQKSVNGCTRERLKMKNLSQG